MITLRFWDGRATSWPPKNCNVRVLPIADVAVWVFSSEKSGVYRTNSRSGYLLIELD